MDVQEHKEIYGVKNIDLSYWCTVEYSNAQKQIWNVQNL